MYVQKTGFRGVMCRPISIRAWWQFAGRVKPATKPNPDRRETTEMWYKYHAKGTTNIAISCRRMNNQTPAHLSPDKHEALRIMIIPSRENSVSPKLAIHNPADIRVTTSTVSNVSTSNLNATAQSIILASEGSDRYKQEVGECTTTSRIWQIKRFVTAVGLFLGQSKPIEHPILSILSDESLPLYR